MLYFHLHILSLNLHRNIYVSCTCSFIVYAGISEFSLYDLFNYNINYII